MKNQPKPEETTVLMTAYLAGELPPGERARVEAMIAASRELQNEFASLKTVWELTAKTLKDESLVGASAPDNFRDLTVAAMKAAPKNNWKTWLFTPILPIKPGRVLGLLLCVMGLAVIVGMLLPSLSQAKAKSRRIACKSNLESLGIPCRMKEFPSPAPSAAPLGGEKDMRENIREKKADGDEFNYASVKAKKKIAQPRRKAQGCVSGYAGSGSRPAAAASVAKDESLAESSVAPEPPRPAKENVAAEEAEIDDFEIDFSKVRKLPTYCLKICDAAGRGKSAPASRPAVSSPPSMKVAAEEAVDEEVPAAPEPRGEPRPPTLNAPAEALIAPEPQGEPIPPKSETSTIAIAKPDLYMPRKSALKMPVAPAASKGKAFKVDLKKWDLEDKKDVVDFLKRQNVAVDEKAVRVNRETGELTIAASAKELAKVSVAFDALRNEEKKEKEASGLPFVDPKKKPFSTFSIDTDTASYVMARKRLLAGSRPEPETVRPEDFINYFDYHYLSPGEAIFGVRSALTASPFRAGEYLFRIGVQGRELGPGGDRPTAWTLLVDTSGSMARKDRLGLAKTAIGLLLDRMSLGDRAILIGYDDNPRIMVENQPTSEKARLVAALKALRTGGSSDLEKGLTQAAATAERYYLSGGQNRIVLFTDAISGLDKAARERLLRLVDALRKKGIGLTVIGLGGDGDDASLEALAARGDSFYAFIDNAEEAVDLFDKRFSARFREIARDVKIQVEFNPGAVTAYRQVGYDNRRLSKADFRNDKVDAGEVGSGQSVTALYALKLNPKALSDPDTVLATVRIRYRRADTLEIEEKAFYLCASDRRVWDAADPACQLAALVGEFAESLKYPDAASVASPEAIGTRLRVLLTRAYGHDGKVKELKRLIESAR